MIMCITNGVHFFQKKKRSGLELNRELKKNADQQARKPIRNHNAMQNIPSRWGGGRALLHDGGVQAHEEEMDAGQREKGGPERDGRVACCADGKARAQSTGVPQNTYHRSTTVEADVIITANATQHHLPTALGQGA